MLPFQRSASALLAVAVSLVAVDACRAQYPPMPGAYGYPVPMQPVYYYRPPVYYQPVMYVPAGTLLRPPMNYPVAPPQAGYPAPPPSIPATAPQAVVPQTVYPEAADPARNAARHLQATPANIPVETAVPPSVLPECSPVEGCAKGTCCPKPSPWSIQTLIGAQTNAGLSGQRYQYGSANVRIGYLLDHVYCEGSALRGQLEPMLDVTGGLNFNSMGGWFAGPSALLRYNFTKHDKIRPYVQAGFGGAYNDLYLTPTQSLLGQPVVLLGQAGVGVHYFFKPNWSFDVEGQYTHMSDFIGGSVRNQGVDAFGAAGGLTHYFGARQ